MNLFVRIMLVLCCALIPAIGVAIWNESALRHEREAEIRTNALRAAISINDEMIGITDAVRNSLVALSDSAHMPPVASPDCNIRLAEVAAAAAYLTDLRLADADGRVVCASNDNPARDEPVSNHLAFRLARASAAFTVGTYRAAEPGRARLLEFGYPLVRGDGAVQGVLLAGISIDWMLDMLRRKPLPQGSSVALVDRDGTFVARLPDDALTGTLQPAPYRFMLRGDRPATLEGIGSDGVRRVVGYVPLTLPPTGLFVSVGYSVEQSFAAIDAAWRRGITLIGLGGATAVLLAWVLTSRFIGRSVQNLVAAANRWRDGDLSARTKVTGGSSELQRVASAFDEMAEQLERRSNAVRETEERFELARAAASLGIWDWEVDSGRTTWSEQNWTLHGLTPTGPGPSYEAWARSVHPADLPTAEAQIDAALRQEGQSFEMEYRVRLRDGGIRWLLGRGLVLRRAGRPLRMVGINMDITARKAADAAVIDAMRLLRQTHQIAGTGSFEIVLPSRMVTVSEEWVRISGFPPGTTSVQIADAIARIEADGQPLLRTQLDSVLQPDGPSTFTLEYGIRRLSDGAVRRVTVTIEVIRGNDGQAERMLGVLRDVTEQREAESALRTLNAQLERRVQDEVAAREAAYRMLAHAERMQALGQLAGGIAHDFNNVLAAIQGAAELIARRKSADDSTRRLARVALDAARRGASITGRLLTFGRRSDLKAEALAPGAVLADAEEMLRFTIGASISIRTDCPDVLPPMQADRGQLETALVNLVTNARDAMPDGGTVTLAAAAETVDDDAADLAAGRPVALRPGRYIRLSVTDTGLGMDAATLARVTEPFFTTKPPGQGTGLGVSMVQGFAEQSGGAMAIRSAPGAGTTVTLWLPQATTAGAATDAARPAADTGRRRGDDRPVVLLVDDEPLVREVTAVTLEDAGYIVLLAENGREALALLDVEERVDILITDLAMPGMDGVALIRAAQDKYPGLPAILVTGYAGDAMADAIGQSADAFALLRKPLVQADLQDRVASMIAAARPVRRGARPKA